MEYVRGERIFNLLKIYEKEHKKENIFEIDKKQSWKIKEPERELNKWTVTVFNFTEELGRNLN